MEKNIRTEKGQFKKGCSGNPTGRPKRYDSTMEIRDAIQTIVQKNIYALERDLKKMSAYQRWMIIEKVSKYFMPTLTKADVDNKHEGLIEIVVSYDEPRIHEDNIGENKTEE